MTFAPQVFPKMYFLEREWGPVFFLFFNFNFNIIISHIFPENVIIKIPQAVQKIWRFSPSILALFIIFRIFWHFLITKKIMVSHITDDISNFYFEPSLNRLFNSTYLHVCVWYCRVSENIVKMRMGQEDI